MFLQELKQEIIGKLKEKEFNNIDIEKILKEIDAELNSEKFLSAVVEFYIFLKTEIKKMEVLKDILENGLYD
ncbi:hypothetical protein [[Clostridium] colinum]|uniref:hypothetical protein n=1 Tax=[Clostridium] colinum TaxID=36835 RepID=UPI002023E21F|nr:hypothetical protein [[Clostridium] colinum]